MRKVLQSVATMALCTAAIAVAQAAPKQIVVVVADGLSPQVIDLGSAYVKASSTDPDTTVAFSDLKSVGKIASAKSDALASMRGVLKIAAANGYKTGIVTTGNVASDAALLYDLPSDSANIAGTLLTTTKPDFLAGGGRSDFSSALTKTFTASGHTVLLDAEAFEAVDEVKGRVLALQSDSDLTYALDNDSSTTTSVGDLTSLAIKNLGGDNASPYILIVHNTNIAKALAAKDTPALLGELREVDGIIGDVLSTRNALDAPGDLALAVVSTGAASFPKYTSETAGDRSNAIFVASQLTSSYTKATQTLKGAKDDDITTFATDVYPNWKPSAAVRSQLLAGTMTGEDAVRASYETAIQIGYHSTSVAPLAYVVGMGDGDVVESVAGVVSKKPMTSKTK